MSSMLTLAQVLGPVAEASAKAAVSMQRVAALWSEMTLRINTRIGAARGLVGVENATEAEIQRRQVTRIAGARGLVGVQNPTEAEIYRRIATRLTLGAVGTLNATQVEIYMRMATAYVSLPPRARGLGEIF